ncbi:MAG: BFD-like (2Fe-2S) binding domain protein [candidate division BRC1 bacterium ADurb.BinA292]|nr:MAG: BFD-like (2Fe-2S) binding domain protein [candidate division BRC1 bacterium ADurb.BinA292]
MAPSEDREVCLCFHVPLGKLRRFHERRRARVASQFAECHGAGTGCGWCVPYLQQVFEQLERGEEPRLAMSAEEYRARRIAYHKEKKPELPPPADADGPIALDLDELLDDVPDDLKLD